MSSIVWLQVAGGLVLLLVAGLAFGLWRAEREQARLRRKLEAASHELQQLQLNFTRFAPQEVVERIVHTGEAGGGEKKEVTVLFADLVAFTSLAESVEPAVLVRILNGYFERMSGAVREHRGHISTLIGDGMLVLFGALERNPWQATDAVAAALAMQRELALYNRELESEGLPRLSLGVGLHRGVGVAGLVGSRDLMQFTVVGRTINVAARIQDLTRQHDADILVTREVQEKLDGRFQLRTLEPVSLKGVVEEVPIFAVDGLASADPELSPDLSCQPPQLPLGLSVELGVTQPAWTRRDLPERREPFPPVGIEGYAHQFTGKPDSATEERDKNGSNQLHQSGKVLSGSPQHRRGGRSDAADERDRLRG